MKKVGDLFNVSVGADNGPEICELIGILLNLVGPQHDRKIIGIYRDN